MKIIIVGGTGTIGKAVAKELGQRHTILVAGRGRGSDLYVDICDNASIDAMYKAVGMFDAVVSAAGKIEMAALLDMTPEKYGAGLRDKLMGQVNLVLGGLPYITDMGSFTLTSGVLSHDPARYCSSGSMVNAAIDGFVKGAAIEMPRGLRINAVSPTLVEESIDIYGPYFRGYVPVPVATVALAFSKSVEGAQTGQVYHCG